MGIRFTGNNPEKDITTLATEVFEDLIKTDDKVVYLDADLMGSLKTQGLWKKYPNNVLNCGIQEADMVGVAAGLYIAGFKPYIHSFTPFASRRVFDQLFLSVAYAKKSVRVIGSDAGIMATYNGGTHMCFEDIAMMRTVPNACIVDVTDGAMFASFMKSTKDRPGLTYIRTARRGIPDVYTMDTEFQEGKGKILIEGSDVTIIASGIMVQTALQASELLKKDNIAAKVIDIVTIKPLDKELIEKCACETGAIVTAENASIHGGLGGAVSEVVCSSKPVPIEMIGIKDEFGQVGNEQFLRQQYHLQCEDIIDAVHKVLNRK